jgi:hypothetical protein
MFRLNCVRIFVLVSIVLLLSACSDSNGPSRHSEGTPEPEFLPSALWVMGSQGVLLVDDADGKVVLQLPHTSSATAFALDEEEERVWIFVDGHLRAYGFDGWMVAESAVPDFNPSDVNGALEVDKYTGEVWLAHDKRLLHYNPDGLLLQTFFIDEESLGIAMDAFTETLWVLTDATLYRYHRDGKKLEAIHLGMSEKPSSIAWDEALEEVWVTTPAQLVRYDRSGALSFEKDFAGIDYLAPDGRGRVWVSTSDRLFYLDASANTLLEMEIAGLAGEGSITALCGNAGDASVWVAVSRSMMRISTSGDVLRLFLSQNISEPGSVRSMVHYSHFTIPSIAIHTPAGGSHVNDSRALIGLTFGDRGVSIDPASLEVYANEELLTVSCVFGKEWAECRPQTAFLEGPVRLSAFVADSDGNRFEAEPVTFNLDITPPRLTLGSPTENLWTRIDQLEVTGEVNEPSTLTLNDDRIETDDDFRFARMIQLAEGSNSITITAHDLAGNAASIERDVNLKTVPPPLPDISHIRTSGIGNEDLQVTGDGGAVEPFATIRVTNLRTKAVFTATADKDGGFSLRISALPGDQLEIEAEDRAGNTGKKLQFQCSGDSGDSGGNDGNTGEDGDGANTPDPVIVAPKIDSTVVTSLRDATRFLYTGPNPIQRGVVPETIDTVRAAVIRGRVITREGAPLSGVRVSIKNSREYGYTFSRGDGVFDLAVNGGKHLVVNYEKEGYLPAQRKAHSAWQDYALVEDVALIPLDDKATVVGFAGAPSPQVARGNVVTDADGKRQATIFFPAGITAEMVMPDGSRRPLSSGTVRATEYTVGPNGPAAMPGELPPTTGYTYAVELSVDEAMAAGAREVRFSEPAYLYVENFLEFPTGGIVPAGWYDRQMASWIPSDNGLVITILSTSADLATVDIDGTGDAAGDAALAAIGMDAAERRRLAALYEPGQSLWRTPIPHFTPWDCNWPYGPPEDAEPPPEQRSPPLPPQDDRCKLPGCVIDAQAQNLGESMAVTGTPYTLHYNSERSPGGARNHVDVRVKNDKIPASLLKTEVRVNVAGRSLPRTAVISPQTWRYTWDGYDVYGRKLTGQHVASVTVTYDYPMVYYPPGTWWASAFSRVRASGSSIGRRSRGGGISTPVRISRTFQETLSAPAPAPAINGWALDVHHNYDPMGRVLHMGDGGEMKAADVGTVLRTLAVKTNTRSFATSADGGLLISTENRILHLSLSGTVSVVAGTGAAGFAGDGGPASDALLHMPSEIAPDGMGGFYFADSMNHRVRHVNAAGVIRTVAGGDQGFGGDNGDALQASLNLPRGLAYYPGLGLYIADTHNHRVRHVGQDGIITTVAGRGGVGFQGDGEPGIMALLHTPSGLAMDRQGRLYIADRGNHRVRRLDLDGRIHTVAGGGEATTEGVPATQASLSSPHALAVAEAGFYISASSRVVYVGPDGVMSTVVGGGAAAFHEGGGATLVMHLASW